MTFLGEADVPDQRQPLMRISAKVGGVPVSAVVDSGAQVNLLTTAAAEKMQLNVPKETETLGAAFGEPLRVGIVRGIAVECTPRWSSQETFRVAERKVPEVILGLPWLKRNQVVMATG
mmetsp:Transcript_14542/g.21236  ORF Transcript_14542/g.21236 Transcript_14542/m.21236 type:complete len:118 (+) Transcript_14542:199-552(+)